MKVLHRCSIAAALLLTPAAAHAQCQEQQGGISGFIESLLDIFRSKKIKFDTAKDGAGEAYTGEIEVKAVNCGSTTLNVRIAKSVYAKAEGGKGPVSGGVDIRAGGAAEYELTLPNKDWEKTHAPPNPLDPKSLPPGGTMVFRREYFVALGLEAQYKALAVSAGYEEGSGVAVAVQRTPDGKTKLLVGPYSVVKTEATIGVPGVGIGVDQKLENGKIKSWTFDPDDPGDTAEYQNLFGQGILSADGKVLTRRPSETIEYATYENQSGIRLSGGPVSFGGNINMNNRDLRFVTRPDGTVEGTATSVTNGTIMEQVRQWDSAPPNGKRIGEDKLSVAFTETAGLDYLAQAVGEPMGPGGFKIDITEENWKEWRDRAKAYKERHPDRGGFPIDDLANAQSATDVATTLFNVGSNALTNDTLPILLMVAEDPGQRKLPGGAGEPACPNATAEPNTAETATERATQLAKKWCGSNVNLYAPTASVALPLVTGAVRAGNAQGAGKLRD